ncbi:MAG: hypothetical protein C9356_02815 [Oleiphilus sp.]|nr:MAG: hypothetical protein C9356_02815 [Oleiphilus sp.]
MIGSSPVEFYSSTKLTVQNQAINNWAKKYDLVVPTVWLFDVFRFRDLEIESFSLILEFVSDREVLTLIENWDDSIHARNLFRLGLRAQELLDTGLFSHPFGIDEILAKEHKRHFFLLLFLCSNADADFSELQNRLPQLKTWIFVKALEAIGDKGICFEKSVFQISRFFSFDDPETKSRRMPIADRALASLVFQTEGLSLDYQNFSTQITQLFSREFGVGAATSKENKTSNFLKLYQKEFEPLKTSVESGGLLSGLKKQEPISIEPYFSLEASPEPIFLDDGKQTATNTTDLSEKPEYQALSSRTILYTSAEQALYLPWSHFKPAPPETEMLKQWLCSDHFKGNIDRSGQLLVYMCVVLGRVPVRVEDISISTDLSLEWSISPSDYKLRRVMPRREAKSRVFFDSQIPIQSMVQIQIIELPEFLLDAAVALFRGNEGQLIGSVWRRLSSMTLDQWFNRATEGVLGLSRVRPSMLQYCQEQNVYLQSESNSLARLVAHHPNQKLPSLASYHTWIGSDILSLELGYYTKGIDANSLVFGSELNIDDSYIETRFRNAYLSISKGFDSLIEYHNAFCLYSMLAIDAATGARPVRDPFESLPHFNLQKGLVYINDKSDGLNRDGRLCIVPLDAVIFVENYISHLRKLARLIRKISPNFSKQLIQLTEVKGNRSLPLFFLLDKDLKVISIGSKHFAEDGPLDWSMASNFLRHRYSKRMLRKGCPEEVVEGLTGHSDLGISCYGASSSRCFEADMQIASPIANEVFSSLNIQPIKSVVEQYKGTLTNRIYDRDCEPLRFGIRARRQDRIRRNNAAETNAEICVNAFLSQLNVQLIAELSQDQFSELQGRLLNADAGQPHPQAGIRFRYLRDRCLEEGPRATHYLKLTQRIDSFPLEPACFKEDASRAINVYEKIRKRLDVALNRGDQGLVWVSRQNLSDCHYLFLLLLILETRTTSSFLVERAINLKGIRLVSLSERYYIEFLDDAPEAEVGAHVQRHKISLLCAKYLNRLLGSKSKFKRGALPTVIRELVVELSPDGNSNDSIKKFFLDLAGIVRSYNYYSLPGILAASLDGAPHPTSLPWSEWVGVQNKRALVPTTVPPHISDMPVGKSIPLQTKQSDHMTDEALTLLSQFRRILSDYLQSDSDKSVIALQEEYDEMKFGISPAASLFFRWIIHVVQRGKQNLKTKRRSPYARRSLLTVLSLLGRPYISLFGEVDWRVLGEDEFDELLADLIDSREGKVRSQWQYLLYLRRFLLWAETTHALTDIRWDLLYQAIGEYRHVSAGLVFENEYLETLKLLYSENFELRIEACFIVILGYRFGLRFSEAAWLRRQDLYFQSKQAYISVQGHSERALKRTASNRVVPLLFDLNELEQKIIELVQVNFDNRPSLRKSLPLLFLSDSPAKIQSDLTKIAIQIKRALYISTQRSYITEHHLRHSFNNKIVMAMYMPTKNYNSRLGATNADHIRRVLLGSKEYRGVRETRAIMRLMGHASVKPGHKSYTHIMTLWSDRLVKDYRHQQVTPLSSAIDVLTKLKPKQRKRSAVNDSMPGDNGLVRLFHLLGGYARGRNWADLVHLLEIDCDLASRLKRTISEVAEKRYAEEKNSLKFMLSKIKPDAWQRLITHSETVLLEQLQGLSVMSENELPNLVSVRGHFFARTSEQVKTIVSWFEFFGVEGSDLKIYEGVYDSDELTNALHGYKRSLVRKFIGDPFRYMEGKIEQRPKLYLGFVLKRNSGTIRNSVELSIAFIVLSLSLTHQ